MIGEEESERKLNLFEEFDFKKIRIFFIDNLRIPIVERLHSEIREAMQKVCLRYLKSNFETRPFLIISFPNFRQSNFLKTRLESLPNVLILNLLIICSRYLEQIVGTDHRFLYKWTYFISCNNSIEHLEHSRRRH